MSLYVLMYRRLFGVPDVITDMTRCLKMVEMKIDILEAYIWISEVFRVKSGFYRSTGGVAGTPRGINGP